MSRPIVRALLAASAAAIMSAVIATDGAVVQTAAAAGATQTFIVLAGDGQGVSGAKARVLATGGTIVASYDAIGVVIAAADRLDFATAVIGDGVESAAATTGLGTRLETS